MTTAAESRKSAGREYLDALIIAVIFVNFARIFVFQMFKIPTGSMHDNLLVGDHIIVNKFVYAAPAFPGGMKLLPFREVKRGDVVVFRYPVNPAVDFVKRVVALPGETVEIRNKRVLINGRPLQEPYALHLDPNVYQFEAELAEPYRSRDQFGPFRVPLRSYFVLGDNRDLSHDSRYWGPVGREMIKGRALLVYWSFEGRAVSPAAPPIERLKGLVSVVFRFFTDTRWDRTFYVVDSRYHYPWEERRD